MRRKLKREARTRKATEEKQRQTEKQEVRSHQASNGIICIECEFYKAEELKSSV